MKIEENQRKHKKQMGFCNYLGRLNILHILRTGIILRF